MIYALEGVLTPVPSLFETVAAVPELDPRFVEVRDHPRFAPARELMQVVFEELPNPDGNFVTDFQTRGFDARVWELYLFGAALRSGFEVSRPEPQPDFLMRRFGERAWVEAVTANPSQTNARSLDDVPVQAVIDDALPIRYGTPLGRKLARRYWDLPHVSGMPLVIGIADFADADPFRWNGHSLFRYLYGRDLALTSKRDAAVEVQLVPISKHELGTKRIKSGFFSFDGAEHIAAVIFSNSGTVMKFNRMGYDPIRHANIRMVRSGMCYDPDPRAFMPASFAYVVGDVEETWLEGCVIFHNSNALRPISSLFFKDAVQHWCDADTHRESHTEFHGFSSVTEIFVKPGSPITDEEDDQIRSWAQNIVDRTTSALDRAAEAEHARQRDIQSR
jgi:hypothetical protein